MHEGYGSRCVCLCVCLSICYHASGYILGLRVSQAWLSLKMRLGSTLTSWLHAVCHQIWQLQHRNHLPHSGSVPFQMLSSWQTRLPSPLRAKPGSQVYMVLELNIRPGGLVSTTPFNMVRIGHTICSTTEVVYVCECVYACLCVHGNNIPYLF